MKIKKIIFIIKIIFMFFLMTLNSCDKSPTEINYYNEYKPYMTLKIGDIRQYFSSSDNFYLQWKITDTTYRSDGLKVFVIEELIFNSSITFKTVHYNYTNNEYFIETQLDTIFDPKINIENPFLEERLAKIYPLDNQVFIRNIGSLETEKVYFKINLLDSLETPIAKFKNVAKYIQFDADSLNGIYVYYAPEIGHIGSTLLRENSSSEVFIKYIKVNDFELGEYIEPNYNMVNKNYMKMNSKFAEIANIFIRNWNEQ